MALSPRCEVTAGVSWWMKRCRAGCGRCPLSPGIDVRDRPESGTGNSRATQEGTTGAQRQPIPTIRLLPGQLWGRHRSPTESGHPLGVCVSCSIRRSIVAFSGSRAGELSGNRALRSGGSADATALRTVRRWVPSRLASSRRESSSRSCAFPAPGSRGLGGRRELLTLVCVPDLLQQFHSDLAMPRDRGHAGRKGGRPRRSPGPDTSSRGLAVGRHGQLRARRQARGNGPSRGVVTGGSPESPTALANREPVRLPRHRSRPVGPKLRPPCVQSEGPDRKRATETVAKDRKCMSAHIG